MHIPVQETKHSHSEVGKMRCLIISDTHADRHDFSSLGAFDLAIHCGDLTEESKLSEFAQAIAMLDTIKAPVKLVIAGNHDFTLDDEAYTAITSAIDSSIDSALIAKEYGTIGEARALFDSDDVRASGIQFLDPGCHAITIQLQGATTPTILKVFASPATPTTQEGSSKGGLHYHRGTNTASTPREDGPFAALTSDVDIVITHGPPFGLLDRTEQGRAGCEALFAAVAHAQPALHCFGHIHEGWGARKVVWKANASRNSHFTAIDGDRSESIATLRFPPPPGALFASAKLKLGRKEGADGGAGPQTLFVNAALQGFEEGVDQLPWVVDIEVPSLSESDEKQLSATSKHETPSTGPARKRRREEEEEEQGRSTKRIVG